MLHVLPTDDSDLRSTARCSARLIQRLIQRRSRPQVAAPFTLEAVIYSHPEALMFRVRAANVEEHLDFDPARRCELVAFDDLGSQRPPSLNAIFMRERQRVSPGCDLR
jgi:hypothetical protein